MPQPLGVQAGDDEEDRFWSLPAEARSKADGSEEAFLGALTELCEDMSSTELTDPNTASSDDEELEEMCYFFAHLHHEKFGSWPETGSGISRESCSNAAGWREA